MRKRQKEEGSQSDRTWLDLTFAEPEFRSLVGGLWGIMLYTLGVPLWWALIYIYSFSSSLIKKFYPLPILKHWYGDWWSWQILPPNSNRNTQIYCLFSVYFQSLCIFFFAFSSISCMQILFWDWRTGKQVSCLEDSHVEDVTQVFIWFILDVAAYKLQMHQVGISFCYFQGQSSWIICRFNVVSGVVVSILECKLDVVTGDASILCAPVILVHSCSTHP